MSHFSFHLSELFWRFLYPLLFSFFSFLLFGSYFKEVLYLLISNKHAALAAAPFLIISNPLEALSSFLSLCFFLAIITTSLPLWFIGAYLYIRPSLIFTKLNIKLEVIGLSIFCSLPFLSLYLALEGLPYAIKLLLSPLLGVADASNFTPGMDAVPLLYWAPQINSVLSLYISLSIFSFLFLLIPIILIYIQIKIGNPKNKAIFISVARFRPWTILGIWIILAVITPPDLISLLVTGIPLILLLEISLILTLIVWKYSKY